MATIASEYERLLKSICSRDGIVEVTKTEPFKDENTVSETIKVRPFVTEPANVSMKSGVTINLGNYQSARVDIMISVPCYVEEIDEVFNKIRDYIDDRLKIESETITG